MKRKRKVILFSIIAIGASASLVYGILRMPPIYRIGDNLLKNSRFELVNRSGKVKTWVQGPKEGWSVDKDNPYEGENSMKATVEWSWLSQDVRVRPDRYYILKAHARSDMPFKGEEEKDNAFLRLECLDKKNQVIRTDYEIITATSFWQQYMRQMYAPQNTNKIRINIAKRQGEGSVWFDGLELEQISKVAVVNQGFEILDREGKLRYWIQDTKEDWSVDTESPYEGKNSMKATVGWSWLSQDVRVRPDRYYVLKAHVKSDMPLKDEGTKDNVFLALECLDEKNQVIRSDYGIGGVSSLWQEKTKQIYAPEETEKIRIKVAKRQGEGSVWFDELTLEELPLPSLDNSGFETVDERGQPDSWVQDSQGGWTIDTESPYEGENCMKATVGWGWLSQNVSVKPEREYTLQVYAKSDIIIPRGEEDWNAFLVLECLNKEGEIIEENMIQLNIPYSWKPQIISVHAPEGTEKMRIKLAKRHGEGSVWFDNLKIVKLAWYMKIGFLQRIAKDKPFFIFYFAIYFLLLISLIRIILKR